MFSKALADAIVLGALIYTSISCHAEAQTIPGRTGTPKAQVELWRMQCGKDGPLPKAMFSDTFLYPDASSKDFTFSCYLIRHGADYMVWDAGLPAPDAPRIVDQLKQISITPRQINYLGLSHFHFDHIGQAADFSEAKLLIGADDLAAIRKGEPLPDGSTDSATRLAPWISGGKPTQALSGDLDVFGDGTVVVMRMPGHTPGHRSLLVRLPQTGNVLISGDLYHFPENRAGRVVPVFNTDRAQTLASMDRFEELARRLKAIVIIQHEPGDIGKIPRFPSSAR
jgi:glyoxylase-like metal-dependent hydrolase (beta-lactamase superfamily II)